MGAAGSLERVTVLYSGRVQGVGFRYTARSIAGRYRAAGYVRNLPDGRVELVAEGEREELKALLKEVRDYFAGHIREEKADWQAVATGEFTRFEIRH